jgi:uncharacterized protein YceK
MTALIRLSTLTLALAACTLSGCAYVGGHVDDTPAAVRSSAPAETQAVAAATTAIKPAEPAAKAPIAAGDAALADGLKAYQAGQFKQAETQLTAALKAGLTTPADIVAAQKHLAFIYCTSKRDTQCAAAFKAARAADPAFALSKAEAGHPMWARTYKKALGLK